MTTIFSYENHNTVKKLNLDTIKTIDDVKNIFYLLGPYFTYNKDHPDVELIEKYFTIPY